MRHHPPRRGVLAGLGALAFVPVAIAQPRTRPVTVGLLAPYSQDVEPQLREAVRQGLADHGLMTPRDVTWLERNADNVPDRAEALTRQLIDAGSDVIVVWGVVRRCVDAAAARVPVVYGFSGDPVAAGLAQSLARPLGRATGLSLMVVETNAKRIEFLKAAAPAIRRIGLLTHPNHPGEAREVEVCRRAVAALGIELLYMPVHSREHIERALADAAIAGADAIVALPDFVTTPNRELIAAWALARRVPFASGWSEFAESGALLTYGPNRFDSFRRVGRMAARILEGTDPASLPIEQPTSFELVLNLTTARTIGLDIAQTLIGRADQVIE